MEAKRDRGAQRRAIILREKTLLVHPVTSLVHRSHKGTWQPVLFDARGDAYIGAVKTGTEWVNGFILASAVTAAIDCDKLHLLRWLLQERGADPNRLAYIEGEIETWREMEEILDTRWSTCSRARTCSRAQLNQA